MFLVSVGTRCRQEEVTEDVPWSPAVGLLFSFLFSRPSPGWSGSCKGHQTSAAASQCCYPWKKIASLKLITTWHFSSEKLPTWALQAHRVRSSQSTVIPEAF